MRRKPDLLTPFFGFMLLIGAIYPLSLWSEGAMTLSQLVVFYILLASATAFACMKGKQHGPDYPSDP